MKFLLHKDIREIATGQMTISAILKLSLPTQKLIKN